MWPMGHATACRADRLFSLAGLQDSWQCMVDAKHLYNVITASETDGYFP